MVQGVNGLEHRGLARFKRVPHKSARGEHGLGQSLHGRRPRRKRAEQPREGMGRDCEAWVVLERHEGVNASME